MPTPFTPAWLAASPEALAFLPNHLGDLDAALTHRATELGSAATHPAALSALEAQLAARPSRPAQLANLTRLREGALAVLTGQQVGIFLGPLYAIHKAASAIAYAQKAQAVLGKPVVPVFWLQTEDADFAEIASTLSVGVDGLHTLALTRSCDLDGRPLSGERRLPLGDRQLGPEITAQLASLELNLEGPARHEVLAALRTHYRPEATFGQAAAGLLSELFGDAGLVIFDPRASRLQESQRALSEFKAELLLETLDRHGALLETLTQTAHSLEQAGFKVQIPPRPQTSLACYAPEGQDRYRLVASPEAPESLRLSGHRAHYTRASLEAELRAHPERASTTALLRPILQDRLFPTLGYVGGPGELAYFAQLPPLYEAFETAMPLALPRARFSLELPQFERLAKALGQDLSQGLAPRATVEASLLRAEGVLAPLESTQHTLDALLEQELGTLTELARSFGDHSFAKRAASYQARTSSRLTRLLNRVKRAALNQQGAKQGQLERLYAWLLPEQAPQERSLSLVPFAAQVGFAHLGRALIAASHEALSQLPASRVLRVSL